MAAFWYERAYGKIAEAGGTFVVTVFVPFVPIVPLESRLVLSSGQVVPLPLQWRSVLAAYARVWGGLLAALALAFAALVGVDTEVDLDLFTFVKHDDLAVLGRLALIFVPLAVFLAAYGWLGRPSLDELAQRVVYAKRCGHPVDIANGDLLRVEPLRETLRERAPALRSDGYRGAPDPETAWREVASDPSLTDRAYLEDALAVVRCEAGAVCGRERAARLAEHARVWKRLKALAPGLLDEARAHRPAVRTRVLRAAVVVGATSIFAWIAGTTFADRAAHGYGRLSEVLSTREPQVEERGFAFWVATPPRRSASRCAPTPCSGATRGSSRSGARARSRREGGTRRGSWRADRAVMSTCSSSGLGPDGRVGPKGASRRPWWTLGARRGRGPSCRGVTCDSPKGLPRKTRWGASSRSTTRPGACHAPLHRAHEAPRVRVQQVARAPPGRGRPLLLLLQPVLDPAHDADHSRDGDRGDDAPLGT